MGADPSVKNDDGWEARDGIEGIQNPLSTAYHMNKITVSEQGRGRRDGGKGGGGTEGGKEGGKGGERGGEGRAGAPIASPVVPGLAG